MTWGDWIAIVGDLLVAGALVASIVVYFKQRKAAEEEMRRSALAVLEGAKNGIQEWGKSYFSKDYSGTNGEVRGMDDFDAIMHRRIHAQVFSVPTEPLVSIIAQPYPGRLVTTATIKAVNIALWQIGKFNQMVHQQSDFHVQHLAEIVGDRINPWRREQIANAARQISVVLHRDTINNRAWYNCLMAALACNISELKRAGKAPQSMPPIAGRVPLRVLIWPF